MSPVTFQGRTTFGYAEWEGPLVSISGSHITVEGASGSVLDAQGARWWDGQGTNGGKKKPHPFFQAARLNSSTITGLTFKDAPVQVVSIYNCNDLTLNHIIIDNANGDNRNGKEVGHNTDGFDIGASNGVYIYNPVVHNQDDCLCINSGQNIIFSGASCTGGHGISIAAGIFGSASQNVVKNVTVSNCAVSNSANGIRIKTVSGAQGSVSGITYQNVRLSGITQFGVALQQDYKNSGPTGNPTNGVPITGIHMNGVTGSVSGNAAPFYVLCASGACSNWSWSGVSVNGGKKSNACKNVPSPAKC
ncbi:extracellular polygalacturonase [Aphelenchoides avenae]|nr:extracellular polygalacturonase [Aphelenchus avenae]